MVVYDSTDTVGPGGIPASGTIPDITNVTTWGAPASYPYTYTNAVTPLVPGAGTSSFSIDCVNGVATNFRISNAPPFTPAAVPTLGEWALAALAAILAAFSLAAIKRRV